ncbi:MAG: ATP-grasp domain-containing protein [Halieaceae bacterium]|uniref:arsenate reductase/protein-tyrosine-phosphatase family protein n=1 Tax=Haliea alexandrii TaxID=2448162 RepID=UPI000F0B9B86|nr:ATP-grasp domain-containing protein [Haliea alexandrii]MCR9186215.1 ATP-grasp domain-containing protein [Halieaceae bacterium]
MTPALAVARSLNAAKYRVSVASAARRPITSYSKSVIETFRYPDPTEDRSAFLAWFEQHTRQHRYDLVIPVTERSLLPLSESRDQLPHVKIALPSAESLTLALNKNATFKLAEELGISTPRSFYLHNLADLKNLPSDLTWPMVIKPSQTLSGSASGYARRDVSYANNLECLRAQCEACLEHSPVILQTYFQGQGAGIELIARAGEILYAFQHVRLHEVPLTGGGSSLRASTEIAPELLEAAKKLMSAARWTGVAMVEFKWNPDDRSYCLMEINGRLWGSLPLATAAGADFPSMLVDLALTGDVPHYPPYRRGVVCRNLSRDLMWHEMVLRSKSDHTTKTPSGRSIARDLVEVFSFHHYFDIQNFSDPLPGLVDIGRLARQYALRVAGLWKEHWFSLQQRLLWRNGTIREKLRSSRSILFVCYGNINRSVVAEAAMSAIQPLANTRKIRSAGFHEETGRPADPRMVAVAARHNIALANSSSTYVSAELIEESDLIFVMEKRHFDQLTKMYPDTATRTFLLGTASDKRANSIEILDPYNQAPAIYESCFLQIREAVSALSGALQGTHNHV